MTETLTEKPLECLDSARCLHDILRLKVLGPAVPDDPQSLLADLRQVIDLREKLAEIDADLSRRRQEIERRLLDWHEWTGLEQARGGGMSVTFTQAMRPRVDPEKWESLFEWAAATKNWQVLYRQVAAAKLLEVIGAGSPLPEGVTVESYTKINTRRV